MAKWRDIYDCEIWSLIVSKTIKHPYSDDSDLINNLTALIQKYHDVKKDCTANLLLRIELLNELIEITGKYLQTHQPHLKIKQNKKASWIKFEGNYKIDEAELSQHHFDEYIVSLHKQAEKKSDYIKTIKAQNETSGDELKSWPAFKKFMEIRNNNHGKDGIFHLVGGCILEKIDLYHRPFEFDSKDIEQNEFSIPTKYPLNEAFLDWGKAWETEKTNEPFFIWLESHPALTTTPFYIHPRSVSDHPIGFMGWNQLYRTKIKSIKYDELRTDTLTIQDGNISKNENTLFNTPRTLSRPKFACPLNSAAYVKLAGNDEIITHTHKPLEVHHSSLSKGKEVDIAGMWLVKDGKVHYVDNSSGHYRTDSLALYKFIIHLATHNLLLEESKIKDMKYKKSKKLNDYVQWAETNELIKNYSGKKLSEILASIHEKAISPSKK